MVLLQLDNNNRISTFMRNNSSTLFYVHYIQYCTLNENICVKVDSFLFRPKIHSHFSFDVCMQMNANKKKQKQIGKWASTETSCICEIWNCEWIIRKCAELLSSSLFHHHHHHFIKIKCNTTLTFVFYFFIEFSFSCFLSHSSLFIIIINNIEKF